MARIKLVNDAGEIVEEELISREARVIPSDDGISEFSPSVVQDIEYDHKGSTSSITTVCGETENRRNADELPDLTIEGVITEPEIPDIKNLKNGEQITFISDIHSGDVYVKRVTINQSTDILSFVDDSGNEELAFAFQLQLGQPDGEG
jgi:hypothetical protein